MKRILSKDLDATEYILRITNREIMETNLSFIESIENNNIPIITIELNGKDYEEYDAGISFDLYLSTEDLIDYSTEPTNISNKLIDGHFYIMRPSDDDYNEYKVSIPTNTVDDMKKDLTNLYVAKVDNETYLFKLSIPEEGIFTYFEVNIKEMETENNG